MRNGTLPPHRPASAEAMQKATMILTPEFIRGIRMTRTYISTYESHLQIGDSGEGQVRRRARPVPDEESDHR